MTNLPELYDSVTHAEAMRLYIFIGVGIVGIITLIVLFRKTHSWTKPIVTGAIITFVGALIGVIVSGVGGSAAQSDIESAVEDNIRDNYHVDDVAVTYDSGNDEASPSEKYTHLATVTLPDDGETFNNTTVYYDEDFDVVLFVDYEAADQVEPIEGSAAADFLAGPDDGDYDGVTFPDEEVEDFENDVENVE